MRLSTASRARLRRRSSASSRLRCCGHRPSSPGLVAAPPRSASARQASPSGSPSVFAAFELEQCERFLIDVKYTSIHHQDLYWRLPDGRPGLVDIVRELRLPVVHLTRRNLFALYCSLAYAEATGVWAAVDDTNEHRAIVVDVVRCKAYMEQISAISKSVRDWLSGHGVFELEYEAILGEGIWSDRVADTFSKIYGAPPSAPLKTAYHKATPLLGKIVQNAEEVLLALRGTPFQSMAEEALHQDNRSNLPHRQPATTSSHAAAKPTMDAAGSVTLLSADPLVVSLTAVTGQKPIGVAEALGQRMSEWPITFLIPLRWHCNAAGAAEKAAAAQSFKVVCPQHGLIFLGDTIEDVDRLVAAGASAFFANENIFASESDFRPLPGTEVEFDAVYNAKPVPWKRHWLAAEIERVAYISYVGRGDEAAAPAAMAAILRADQVTFSSIRSSVACQKPWPGRLSTRRLPAVRSGSVFPRSRALCVRALNICSPGCRLSARRASADVTSSLTPTTASSRSRGRRPYARRSRNCATATYRAPTSVPEPWPSLRSKGTGLSLSSKRSEHDTAGPGATRRTGPSPVRRSSMTPSRRMRSAFWGSWALCQHRHRRNGRYPALARPRGTPYSRRRPGLMSSGLRRKLNDNVSRTPELTASTARSWYRPAVQPM